MDICGESGFSNSMPLERYIKLMSIKPKRIAEIPECWKQILNDYFSETISSGGSPKTIHDWVKVTDELNAVKDSDSDEAIKFKKYLNCVMSPLIESFLKPLPDISSPDTSEHHYWAEFAHRFFSKALQYFANLDWRILEVPVYASKYRKNFGLNHALEKVVDGKFADILARTWDTKEELFVGEQAGAPTNPDLTKYATDWFKLYRELRDFFGILGYLYEMKMTIMWKEGIYIYEEFGSFTIASHIGMIHQMKAGITKLLEFIEESSKIRHFSFNGDEVQILKRKFQEIITQTQESPPKRPKSKAAC
ncbi:14218_t:CDS:2 [Entrophospora sp. SA101]|nr:14218_t:CDS:2 [Entrophospora sp. SA101]